MNEKTIIHVVPDKVQGEVSALYSVPGTHVLFAGPRECARHNCRMHYRLGRISWLCPTDTELAMGRLESMILDSVESLTERYEREGRELFGIVLYTGCQTEFLNVDFAFLLRKIRKRFHIAAAHHSISRFQRFDRVRLTERDIFGDVFRLLEPVDGEPSGAFTEAASRGIQILSRPFPMDPSNDFHFIAKSAGLDWARNTGEWHSVEEFLRCRHAVLNVVTAEERKPAAEYLESAFGTPWILLKDSRRIEVVDRNLQKLQRKLLDISGLTVDLTKWEQQRKETLECVETVLRIAKGRSLTLDLQKTGHPWDVTRALAEYGFRIEKVILRSFPVPPGMKPPPGMRGGQETPEDRDWVRKQLPDLVIEEKRPDFRRIMRDGACISGLPDFLDRRAGDLQPDRAPVQGMPPGPGGPGGASAEAAFWGYSGIRMLMEQIREGISGRNGLGSE